MHRQVFRLFLSIFLILLALVAIQVSFVTFTSRNLVYSWGEEVFDEFVMRVKDNLSSRDFVPTKSIYDFLYSNVSERISGFILRSPDGGHMLTIGQSGQGKRMPQFSSFSNVTYMSGLENADSDTTATYVVKVPKYRIDMEMEDSLNFIVTGVSLEDTGYSGTVKVQYPSTVSKSDIAGTIEVYINGSLSSYLDVLVYSVDYYNPTRFIMAEIYRGLVVSIPLGLVLSLILAWVVSKRTENNVKDVEDSLKKLSRGQFEVTFPKTNISEYKQIGESIESLGKDLRRHSASRKEWIRNISHDLNTPVTSMNMLLEGMEDGLFPLSSDTLSMLKKENDTLKSRIASVAYYSYLLSPDARCNKEYLSLMDEADQVLQKLHRPVRIAFDPSLVVKGDPSLLERAFEEVVKNALEYGDGTEPIWRAAQKDGRLEITISNRGRLPDPLPLFFEPWARGDSSRTEGGSGLGLSIVYQIMELHGGSVWIREDSSTVLVTLSLPL